MKITKEVVRQCRVLFLLLLLFFCLNKTTVFAEVLPELRIQIGEDSYGDTYTYSEIRTKVNSQTNDKTFALKQEYVYSNRVAAPDIRIMCKEDPSSSALPHEVNQNNYTVSYVNNINAGTAKITVEFDKNAADYEKWKKCKDFVDSQTFTFKIQPKSLGSADITYKIVKNPSFSGGNVELTSANIQVYDGKTLLRKGYDYSVKNYKNNVNVGTASATMVGNDAQRIKDNPTKKFSGNYTGSINFNYEIATKNIGDTDVEISLKSKRYTGQPLSTTATIKIGSYVLQPEVDYTLSYSDNVNVGSAYVQILGKGNLRGTQTANFKIVPVPTVLSKVVRAGSRKLRIRWKSVPKQRSGYQLVLSTKRSFKGSTTKKVTVSYKTLSKTIKNLKKNKKYYVKVRVYKKVDGVKYYSAWSNIRTIVVK